MRLWSKLRGWLGPSVQVSAQEPLARALREHADRGRSLQVRVIRGEGFSYGLDTESFFALEGPAWPLDRLALADARGRVLDVGAGAGRHSLALRERGLEVISIDVSPIAVELMRERGVDRPVQLDVFHLAEGNLGRFDTILFLMQSIGIAGSRFGFESLLETLEASLAPGGQVLLDSSPLVGDVGSACGGVDSDGGVERRGEVQVQFAFGRFVGEPFAWLYLGFPQLEAWSTARGWRCECLARLPSGDYLARLTRPRDAGASPAR